MSTWIDGRRQGLAKKVSTAPHCEEIVIYKSDICISETAPRFTHVDSGYFRFALL